MNHFDTCRLVSFISARILTVINFMGVCSFYVALICLKTFIRTIHALGVHAVQQPLDASSIISKTYIGHGYIFLSWFVDARCGCNKKVRLCAFLTLCSREGKLEDCTCNIWYNIARNSL